MLGGFFAFRSIVAFVTSKDEKNIINARVITLGDEVQSFETK